MHTAGLWQMHEPCRLHHTEQRCPQHVSGMHCCNCRNPSAHQCRWLRPCCVTLTRSPSSIPQQGAGHCICCAQEGNRHNTATFAQPAQALQDAPRAAALYEMVLLMLLASQVGLQGWAAWRGRLVARGWGPLGMLRCSCLHSSHVPVGGGQAAVTRRAKQKSRLMQRVASDMELVALHQMNPSLTSSQKLAAHDRQ